MDWQDRITVDPEVLAGKPIVRGTRLSVEFLIDLLAADWREDDILRNYPNLTHEDLLACLRYAGETLRAGFPINRYARRGCSRAMSG